MLFLNLLRSFTNGPYRLLRAILRMIKENPVCLILHNTGHVALLDNEFIWIDIQQQHEHGDQERTEDQADETEYFQTDDHAEYSCERMYIADPFEQCET